MRALRKSSWPLVWVLLALTSTPLWAQDLASFEKRTTVKKLDNGLTLIVVERPTAPVFSYATWVNVGSANEVPGITGLAHMFEHMAFKGTEKIGTTDYAAESAALKKVEDSYAVYDRERRRETGRDEAKVAAAEKAWKDAIAEADKFVKTDEFSQIVDQAGGVGMNAGTSSDQTVYFYSMPANRFELWAYLESDRFLHPVFREFYKERDVVTEERRMRTESNPIGRLMEQFLATAFIAHPYGFPTVGWPSDLKAFSATDAVNFFHKNYVPANMVIAVVGDVKASEALPVMEKYFGRLPNTPKPEPLRTVEPPQIAEKTVVLHEKAQPFFFEGFHRPAATDPDAETYEVISMMMSNGRTSRLYKSLVRDKKLAIVAQGFNGFPGEKYPNLFTFIAATNKGHTPAEIQAAIDEELTALKTDEVKPEELQSVKTRAKAQLIRQLDSNSGLALQMAAYQTMFGDWRELFRSVDRIDKVTAADVKRVANIAFVPTNRTIAYIDNTPAPAPKPATEAAPKPAAEAPAAKGATK